MDNEDLERLTPLMKAVVEDNLAIVNSLLQRAETNVNEQDEKHWTAAHYAARYGREQCLKKLIEAKAYLCLKNDYEETPLMLAAREGHENIVEMILSCPEFLEFMYEVDYCGQNALSMAVEENHIGCVRLFMEANMDPNVQDRYDDDTRLRSADPQRTPLMVAARRGNVQMVSYLLKAGADPLISHIWTKWTALHYACFIKNLEIVKLLLETTSLDVNQPDRHGDTPLGIVVEMIPEWMDHGIVEYLIEKGADIYHMNNYGHDSISYATGTGNKRCMDIFKKIIDREQEVDLVDTWWNSI